MLTAKGFSETEPYLSNPVFRSLIFSKCSKFNADSKNAIKIQEKVFGFLDN